MAADASERGYNGPVGRVYEQVRIDGQRHIALFDSGARNTFVVPSVAALGVRMRLHPAHLVALGGRRRKVVEHCTVTGSLLGHRLFLDALVIPEIRRGDQGRSIEILVGALAMQLWGIELDLRHERLDLSNFSKEFVEF